MSWQNGRFSSCASSNNRLFPSLLPVVMSAACPLTCCDVLEPFTAVFSAGDLYPLVTTIGLPYASRNGSSTLSTKSFRFFTASGVGSLLIPRVIAVFDSISS